MKETKVKNIKKEQGKLNEKISIGFGVERR